METEITAQLERWSIKNWFSKPVLVGTIFGDDAKGRFKEGTTIITSPLLSIDFERMIARTHTGSIYKLRDW